MSNAKNKKPANGRWLSKALGFAHTATLKGLDGIGMAGMALSNAQRLGQGNITVLNTRSVSAKYGLRAAAVVGKLGIDRLLPPLSVFTMLYSHHKSAQEAARLAAYVTEPTRNADGMLIIKKGGFPFPRGMYEALMQSGNLSGRMFRGFMRTISPEDASMFRYYFIPVASRQDLSRDQREKLYGLISSYVPVTQDVILQRASQHDILESAKANKAHSIVELAANFPGTQRTRDWAVVYAHARGILQKS